MTTAPNPATTAPNPSFKVNDTKVDVKIPIWNDVVGATKALGDGKLNAGDFFAIADMGFGILTTALDPLGAILGAAVDLLLDVLLAAFKPFSDAVDKLLGNGDKVAEVAQKWADTGTSIVNSGNEYVNSLGSISSWQGEAAENYRSSVQKIHGAYEQAAETANGISGWIGAVGAIVGIFREFVWGLLKEAITQALEAAILAIASAVPSFGASLGAFGTWFTGKMAMLGGKFAKTLSKLLKKVGDLMRKLGLSGRSMDVAAEKLRQVARMLGRFAGRQYGHSGIPHSHGAPTLPGNTKPNFKHYQPGYEGLKDGYDKAKDAGKVVDGMRTGDHGPKLQDLPPEYQQQPSSPPPSYPQPTPNPTPGAAPSAPASSAPAPSTPSSSAPAQPTPAAPTATTDPASVPTPPRFRGSGSSSGF